MINYVKNLWTNIKTKTIKAKILIGVIAFLYVVVSLSCLIKINYVSTTPGGLSKVESVISVAGDHPTGDIHTISVYEYRQVTLLQYLLNQLNPDITLQPFDPDEVMSKKDELTQGTLLKEISIMSAIILAYTEANKYDDTITIDYEFIGIIIHTSFPETSNDIVLGDIITAVDGTVFTSNEEFYTLAHAVLGDNNKHTVSFTIKRGNDTFSLLQPIITEEGRRYIPIGVGPKYVINATTPTYEIKPSLTVGPSGGVMQALAVYNAITPKDITQGLRIVGTGTISTEGIVGNIGGIRQKVITAQLYNADLFFVAQGNYDDAMTAYQAIKNPKFPAPIAVSQFSDLIAYLEGLGD